jgi:hypothetical protein
VATSAPPPDIWATATGKEAYLPTIYRYRKNLPHAADSANFPFALRVTWPYDASVRNGMPPSDENDLHIGFEDAIDPLGNGEFGFLMLVFTGNGRKEWLYYVRDPEQWTSMLSTCLADHQPYPLEIEHWLDREWATWQDFAESVTDGS